MILVITTYITYSTKNVLLNYIKIFKKYYCFYKKIRILINLKINGFILTN